MSNETENSKVAQTVAEVSQFDMDTFALRLRKLMVDNDVTQQQLAEKLGSKRQTISQYVNGTVQPNIGKLYEIAKYFKVSADYLLGLDDGQSPDTSVRAIHSKLGLSENSIKYLSNLTEMLREVTGRQTLNEALEIQQKIRESVFEFAHKGDPLAVKSYVQTLGIPLKYGKADALDVIVSSISSPIFKTIDTLIEDNRQDIFNEHNAGELFANSSILKILENIFRQKNLNNNNQYVLIKYDKDSKQGFEMLHNNEMGVIMKGNEILSLYLLQLQNALINWRNSQKDKPE